MQTKWSRLCTAAMCSTALIAAAQTPASDEISRLGDEIVVLQTRLKALDAKVQLAAKEQELKKMEPLPAAAPSEPVLLAVEGVGHTLYATLMVSIPGSRVDTLEVRNGDVLPDGWRVTSVQSNEVIISRHKDRKALRLKAINAPPSKVASDKTTEIAQQQQMQAAMSIMSSPSRLPQGMPMPQGATNIVPPGGSFAPLNSGAGTR